jgi:hypothetical protein
MPMLTNIFVKTIEKFTTRGGEILGKLDDFIKLQSDLNNQNKTHIVDSDKMKKMIEELIDDNNGNLDSNLALSTFTTFQNSIHMRLYIFFWRRVEANHILNNSEIVRGRYSAKVDELKGKTMTQMGKYHFKGQPLSMFWGQGGADSFFNHISAELYSLQYLRASGDEFAMSITNEDLESAFDRILSRLMGAFKIYLDTGKNYKEIKDVNTCKLFSSPKEIEEL